MSEPATEEPKSQTRQALSDASEKLERLNADKQSILQRLSELSRVDIEAEAERVLSGESVDSVRNDSAEIETLEHRLKVIDSAMRQQQSRVSEVRSQIKQEKRLKRMPEHKQHIKAMSEVLTELQQIISDNKAHWQGVANRPSTNLPINSQQIANWQRAMKAKGWLN